MITQIEIDGFKTFKDFKVELAPFQVIVGPNGSGKSNLFDALHLLSRLAEKDIYTAFQELRGDAGELFTKYPDGKTSERIKIAVEMLVDRKIQDDLGREFELKHRRLRYELEVAQGIDESGLDRLTIRRESLQLLSQQSDSWYKKYYPDLYGNQSSEVSNTNTVCYSLTQRDKNLAGLTIHHEPPAQLESGAEVLDEYQPIQLDVLNRTILSSSIVASSHAVIAVRAELGYIRFFHLNPEALRKPSSINASRYLAPDGSNLPTILARMQSEDEFALTDVSRAVASMVQDISRIKVQKDEMTNKYAIWAETVDHRTFSAEVLSDGTLRLLALAALSYDPHFRGTLCLEEPENGVQPLQLEKMALLLREMATDLNDPVQIDEPLRQVLITTHSSLFISQPSIIDSLLLAITASRIQGKGQPVLHVTRMEPVVTPNTLSQIEHNSDNDIPFMSYTIHTVRRYLGSNNLEDARNQLNKAHSQLPKKE
jgi:predicted ATPase